MDIGLEFYSAILPYDYGWKVKVTDKFYTKVLR